MEINPFRISKPNKNLLYEAGLIVLKHVENIQKDILDCFNP
jgi:hypothetical protein